MIIIKYTTLNYYENNIIISIFLFPQFIIFILWE